MKLNQITPEHIRKFGPCYDPVKTGVVEESWSGTILDVFELDISQADKLWVALETSVLPESFLRSFLYHVYTKLFPDNGLSITEEEYINATESLVTRLPYGLRHGLDVHSTFASLHGYPFVVELCNYPFVAKNHKPFYAVLPMFDKLRLIAARAMWSDSVLTQSLILDMLVEELTNRIEEAAEYGYLLEQ